MFKRNTKNKSDDRFAFLLIKKAKTGLLMKI